MESTTDWLDAKGVAALLGMSEHWVRLRTKAGEIPHFAVGGLKRYRKADIEAYVESLRVAAK